MLPTIHLSWEQKAARRNFFELPSPTPPLAHICQIDVPEIMSTVSPFGHLPPVLSHNFASAQACVRAEEAFAVGATELC
jgi:hypothetical protein